jgi:hypothetical protein
MLSCIYNAPPYLEAELDINVLYSISIGISLADVDEL